MNQDTETYRLSPDHCVTTPQVRQEPKCVFTPYRLVSLWEIMGAMERFNAEDLSGLSYNLGQYYMLEKLLELGVETPEDLTNVARSPIHGDFDYGRLRNQLKRLGCDSSVDALDRMQKHTEQGMDTKEAFVRLHTLQNDYISRLYDELNRAMLLSLTVHEAGFYESPLGGWQEVVDALPDTSFDIEEASKCYAMNRHTAMAFHIMRAVEIGMQNLHTATFRTENPEKGKPKAWGGYITEIETYAKTQPTRQDILSEVAAHLRTVKIAWRNPTMHVDKVYTEEMAREIYNASKALLRSIIRAL